LAKTKYKKQYAADLEEYFMRFLRGCPDGEAVYPSMVRFADKIGVTTRTLTNWKEKYPETFGEAYDFAQEIQDEVLNENALNGKFDGKVAMKIRELKANTKATEDNSAAVKVVFDIKDDRQGERITIKKWDGEVNEDRDY
jgi:hypothetical protein